jgi:hypothetical protein
LPRRLLLKRAKRSKVSMGVDDLFDGGGTKSADQLVFQVFDAYVETEPFHFGVRKVGAEAGSLETAPELALLSGVAKAGQSDVEPVRAEPFQETADGLRAAHRNNGDPLGVEISTETLGQRFDRDLIADPFDEHDRARG